MRKTAPACVLLLVASCLAASAQDPESPKSNDSDLLDKLSPIASKPENPLAARIVAVDVIGKLQTKDSKVRDKQKTILLRLLRTMTPARLNDDDDTVVLATHVVQALGAMGSDARDALPSIVEFSGYEANLTAAVKTAVQAILKPVAVAPPPHATGKSTTDWLADLANMKDAATRVTAAKALGDLADPSALAPLATAAASDPNPDVKMNAGAAFAKLTAVVQLNRKQYVTSLASMMDKANDVSLRIIAAKKLGELGNDALPAVDALTAASTEADPDLKQVALNALKRIQPK